MEGLLDHISHFAYIFYQIVVLRAWTGNPYDIHFLKCVISDKTRIDLSGKHNNRDGIHIGGSDACNGIGCAWPGRYKTDTYPAGRTGVTVRRVNRTLLMADQYMSDIRL